MRPLKSTRIHIPHEPSGWREKNWTREKLSTWIANAGGKLLPHKDGSDATHVVIPERCWRNVTRAVQEALDTNEDGGDVKIVSPDWLEASLTVSGAKKVNLREYSWQEFDEDKGLAVAAGKRKKGGRGKKAAQPASGVEDDDEVEEVETPKKGHMALLGQTFEEATDPFVDPRQKKKLELQIAREEKAKREQVAEEQRRIKEERLAAAAAKRQAKDLIRRGLKKGAAEVFSVNHHIYTDHTGFSYDVTLTKVNTHRNRNERLVLTIFESNAFPHTYATNLHSAGTGLRAQNNILAALGTPFATAFAKFRKAFREQTGLEWDQRISGHNERVLAKQAGRAGQEGNETETWFRYQPPAYGPKGVLEGVVDEVPEVVRRGRERSARSGEMQEVGQEPGQEHGMELPRSNDRDFVETWREDAGEAELEPRRGSSIVHDDIRRASQQVDHFGGQDLVGQFSTSAEYGAATTAATVPETSNFDFGNIFNDPVFGNGQGFSGYQNGGQEYDFNFGGNGEVMAQTGDQMQAAGGNGEVGKGMAPDQMDFDNGEPAANKYAYDNVFAPMPEQQNNNQTFQQPASDFGPKHDELSAYQASVYPASEPAQKPSAEFQGFGTGAADVVAPYEVMDYSKWWSNTEAQAGNPFPQSEGAQFADQADDNTNTGDVEVKMQEPSLAGDETQIDNPVIAQELMDFSIPNAPDMSGFTGLLFSDSAGGLSFLDGDGLAKDGQTSNSQAGFGAGFSDAEGVTSMLGKRKREEDEKDGGIQDGCGEMEGAASVLEERKSMEPEKVGEIAV